MFALGSREYDRTVAVFLLRLILVVPLISSAHRLVDLTYTFGVDAPVSPKLRPFQRTEVKKGYAKSGHWVELSDFCTSEHSGTHLDAPRHNDQKGWPVDAIPVDRLFRVPGVVIDVSRLTRKDENYEIKVADLEHWDGSSGPVPDGAVVLIYTGRSREVKETNAYSGLDQFGKLNSPGLGAGAARWLGTYGERHQYSKGVVGVGIDTLSLDVGQSWTYPAHVALAQRNIYGLENVANMNKYLLWIAKCNKSQEHAGLVQDS